MSKRYIVFREFLEYEDGDCRIIYEDRPLTIYEVEQYMKDTLASLEYGNPTTDYTILDVNRKLIFDEVTKESINLIQEIVYKTYPKRRHISSDTCRMYVEEVKEDDVTVLLKSSSNIFFKIYKYDFEDYLKVINNNDIRSKLLEFILRILIRYDEYSGKIDNPIDLRYNYEELNYFLKKSDLDRTIVFLNMFQDIKDLETYFTLQDDYRICFKYNRRKWDIINIPVNNLLKYFDNDIFELSIKIIQNIIDFEKNKEG